MLLKSLNFPISSSNIKSVKYTINAEVLCYPYSAAIGTYEDVINYLEIATVSHSIFPFQRKLKYFNICHRLDLKN